MHEAPGGFQCQSRALAGSNLPAQGPRRSTGIFQKCRSWRRRAGPGPRLCISNPARGRPHMFRGRLGGLPSLVNLPSPWAEMWGSPGASAPRLTTLPRACQLCLLHISRHPTPTPESLRSHPTIFHPDPGKDLVPGKTQSSPPSPPSSFIPAWPGAPGPHSLDS